MADTHGGRGGKDSCESRQKSDRLKADAVRVAGSRSRSLLFDVTESSSPGHPFQLSIISTLITPLQQYPSPALTFFDMVMMVLHK